MRILVASIALFCSLPAFAECPDDANETQAAYCAAREAVLALPEGSIERAKAWEHLAANEAHEQSTRTGLPGQKDGKPNYASAEAFCLNNAGHIYWLHSNFDEAVRCLEKALATPGINNECKKLATGTLKAARDKTKPPSK